MHKLMPKTIPPLSTRQRQILTTIQAFRDQHGYPPTVREIAQHVGLRSSSTVQTHLRTLQRIGMLTDGKKLGRAIERVKTSWQPDTNAVNYVPIQRPFGMVHRGGHFERGCCFEVTNLETGLRFVEVVDTNG
ncbi:MAG TPA: hypothetical protein VN519_06415 [Bryobacteraceae bacterium]|nr:hypothetical protein [Bryobacteraceae bacterium]